MALVVKDRVQELTTTSGTGTLTLSGAVPGYQTFSSSIGNGNTTFYTIYDNTAQAWEVGIGTVGAGTLARNTVLSNSLGTTALISFAGNSSFVFCTYPAEQSVNLDASDNVSPLGTVASGTWQGTTIGVAYGGTGVTTSSGANSVMLRDANQNVAVNRLNQSNTNTSAAGGVTALTTASSYIHTLSGTGNQTYTMPDATTLSTGVAFLFNNMATGTLTLQDYATGSIGTIPSGGAGAVFLTVNATVGGTWDLHAYLPEGVTFGTNAFNLGTSVITGGTWNGGTIGTAYGGTGLTTFSAANYALYSTSASALVAGTLPSAAGGTGFATYTTGDIIYASATNTLSKLAAGTNGYVLTLASGVPSWAVNNAATTRTTTEFTATASQTTFTVAYTVGLIDVYRNGVKLAPTDFTATNGTSVILATGANSGDTIETVAYSALSIGSGVTTFSGGTTGFTPASGSGNVTLAGTLATTNGGTGLTSFTSGGAVYATSTSALTTGTLPVASGGTGVTSSTGSGNNVLSTSPTLVTPVLGVATATSINKVALTSPATGSTLTIADGKTLTASNSLTLAGTDSTVMTFPAASATVAGLGTTQTFTATQTFTGSTTEIAAVFQDAAEVVTVSATAATGTIQYDVTTQSVLYYTTNASANWTVNIRGNATTSLNTLMSTGQAVTVVFLVTQGATAYYNNALTIDGTSVTPKYQGGTAYTSGNASGIDAYSYTIVKTGSAAFTVFAAQTQFK
jgi:hypothetical protein